MTQPATRRYRARFAGTAQDLEAAQRLRFKAFHTGDGLDRDAFDPLCRHVLVEDAGGTPVCTCRLMVLENGAALGQSYSAQFYDLSAMHAMAGPLAEVGRFCIDPALNDPDIFRVAWAFLTQFVDENRIKLLFGCTSFAGTDAAPYRDTFALLKDRHLGPEPLLPKIRAPQVFDFARALRDISPDLRRARLRMPPLLRSYLGMGGWVSDHAVVDRDMNTLHVFTGLEIAAIPPARKRLLRALASGARLRADSA